MRRAALIGPAVAIALAAAPAQALGASVRVDKNRLIYQAAPGEQNDLRIEATGPGTDPSHIITTFRISDSVPVAPGTQCSRPDPGNPTVAQCWVRPDWNSRMLLRLGDRSDSATFSNINRALGVRVQGGPGDDELTVGAGDDVLEGGPGDDVMSAGPGADAFEEDRAANGSDEMVGGDGADSLLLPGDRVDYSGRRNPVRADLSGDRDDGERGERDRIGADVESLSGGRGDDWLIGNGAGNRLIGRLGTDVLAGGGGADVLLAGGFGISPDATNDRLSGGSGSDDLFGSAGANVIAGGADADLIFAGDGRDTVRALDAAVDQLHCGADRDRARIDGFDYPLSCERHDSYSDTSFVPLDVRTGSEPTDVSVLLGCRERHPGPCKGSFQLELGGEAITPKIAFDGANRHRWVVWTKTNQPLPDHAERRPDFVVRVRSQSATGAPTNDAFPVPLPRHAL